MNKIKYIMLLSLVLSVGVEARTGPVAGKKSFARTRGAFSTVVGTFKPATKKVVKKLGGVFSSSVEVAGRATDGIKKCGTMCINKAGRIYEAVGNSSPIARLIESVSNARTVRRLGQNKKQEITGQLAESVNAINNQVSKGDAGKKAAIGVVAATLQALGGKLLLRGKGKFSFFGKKSEKWTETQQDKVGSYRKRLALGEDPIAAAQKEWGLKTREEGREKVEEIYRSCKKGA